MTKEKAEQHKIVHKNTEAQNGISGIRPKVTEILDSGANKRELSPEDVDSLLKALQSQFKRALYSELRELITWDEVERTLRAHPEDMYSIDKLRKTDGETCLVGIDGDELIFEDRSKDSPKSRRNLNFYEADAQRKAFGPNVKFQSTTSYKAMCQETRLPYYDYNRESWLETPAEKQKRSIAIVGMVDEDDLWIKECKADSRDGSRGWRATVRVKRV